MCCFFLLLFRMQFVKIRVAEKRCWGEPHLNSNSVALTGAVDLHLAQKLSEQRVQGGWRWEQGHNMDKADTARLTWLC